MRKLLIVLLAMTLVMSLASCKKCKDHVDADDDYLCDKCGANFDDGDETPELPDETGHKVTFIVKFDSGEVIPDARFSIIRGDFKLDLTSGADGKAEATLEMLAYSFEFDYDSLPEYSTTRDFGFKVEEGTTTIELVIVNNKPDGTAQRPFLVVENETPITLGAGQVVYYNYRGSSVKYLTVDSEVVTVSLGGESYSLSAGNLPLFLQPEIGTTTFFSLENTSDSEVSFTLSLTAPLGSSENPHELTEGGATVTVNFETTVFYRWVADKDGVLTLTSDNARNNISITKLLEDDAVKMEQTGGQLSVSMEVKAGDVITIGVSALEPKENGDSRDVEITFLLTIE